MSNAPCTPDKLNLLHQSMTQSEYFRALYPYLRHLNEAALLALPVDHFKSNPPVDMVFRIFHERYITKLRHIDTRLDELMTVSQRFRCNKNYQNILDEIRRQPPRTPPSQ